MSCKNKDFYNFLFGYSLEQPNLFAELNSEDLEQIFKNIRLGSGPNTYCFDYLRTSTLLLVLPRVNTNEALTCIAQHPEYFDSPFSFSAIITILKILRPITCTIKDVYTWNILICTNIYQVQKDEYLMLLFERVSVRSAKIAIIKAIKYYRHDSFVRFCETVLLDPDRNFIPKFSGNPALAESLWREITATIGYENQQQNVEYLCNILQANYPTINFFGFNGHVLIAQQQARQIHAYTDPIAHEILLSIEKLLLQENIEFFKNHETDLAELKNLINQRLQDPIRAHALSVVNKGSYTTAFKEALHIVLPLILKITVFNKTLPAEALQELWLNQSFQEAAEAYDSSTNSESCVKGIHERIITGLRFITPQLNHFFDKPEGLLISINNIRQICARKALPSIIDNPDALKLYLLKEIFADVSKNGTIPEHDISSKTAVEISMLFPERLRNTINDNIEAAIEAHF